MLLSAVIKELPWTQPSACSSDGAKETAATLLPGHAPLVACPHSGHFLAMASQASSRAVTVPWTTIPASLLVKEVPTESQARQMLPVAPGQCPAALSCASVVPYYMLPLQQDLKNVKLLAVPDVINNDYGFNTILHGSCPRGLYLYQMAKSDGSANRRVG